MSGYFPMEQRKKTDTTQYPLLPSPIPSSYHLLKFSEFRKWKLLQNNIFLLIMRFCTSEFPKEYLF
jgi:hypothetical protein